jgi:hypothetical protein
MLACGSREVEVSLVFERDKSELGVPSPGDVSHCYRLEYTNWQVVYR